jgi:hypothetical protein
MAKELRDEGGRHHHLLRSAEEKEKSKTHNRIYPTTRQARHATGAPPPGDQRPPEMEGRGDPARRDVALERALQGKHRERDFERKVFSGRRRTYWQRDTRDDFIVPTQFFESTHKGRVHMHVCVYRVECVL